MKHKYAYYNHLFLKRFGDCNKFFHTFEIGGKDKSFEQIADIPNSYILADAMEFPIGKKLPLWIVGLLY